MCKRNFWRNDFLLLSVSPGSWHFFPLSFFKNFFYWNNSGVAPSAFSWAGEVNLINEVRWLRIACRVLAEKGSSPQIDLPLKKIFKIFLLTRHTHTLAFTVSLSTSQGFLFTPFSTSFYFSKALWLLVCVRRVCGVAPETSAPINASISAVREERLPPCPLGHMRSEYFANEIALVEQFMSRE